MIVSTVREVINQLTIRGHHHVCCPWTITPFLTLPRPCSHVYRDQVARAKRSDHGTLGSWWWAAENPTLIRVMAMGFHGQHSTAGFKSSLVLTLYWDSECKKTLWTKPKRSKVGNLVTLLVGRQIIWHTTLVASFLSDLEHPSCIHPSHTYLIYAYLL